MQIRFTLGQMRLFRKIIKTPRLMEVPDGTSVIELIAKLDKEYQEAIKDDDKKQHRQDLLDGSIKSILQLLWNPKTGLFYEDVGVEARTSPERGSESIPIEKDIFQPLSDGDWIVLTPDCGC